MRQAYDYWQDQPGNYYPKRDEAPSTPRYWLPSRVFSLGRSSSMAFKVNLRNQFEKSKTITTSPPSAPLERTSESHGPRIRPPCSSISQNSSALLPVLKGTEIVAFGEDYQRPAAPERHATVAADPRSGYLTDGFGHRQVIHILLSPQALITNVRNLAGKDLERSKSPQPVPVTFPKSVYPGVRARL